MKIFKLIYMDEIENNRDFWNHIELIEPTHLPKYVEKMIQEGRICEDNVEIFKEKHPFGVQTQSDAIELLKLDGYDIEETTTY